VSEAEADLRLRVRQDPRQEPYELTLTYGSVRGALGDRRPYRDRSPGPKCDGPGRQRFARLPGWSLLAEAERHDIRRPAVEGQLRVHVLGACERAGANRCQSVTAYNLGNLWRRLVLARRIDNWSLTSLRQRLVKTGGRLVKNARYYWLLLAESGLTRRLFGATVRRIAALPAATG